MIERVTELKTEPMVGKYYLVPCVRIEGEWIPVIGPPHEDVELGVPQKHYHRDVRFTSDRHNRSFTSPKYLTAPEQFVMGYVILARVVREGPEDHRLLCKRTLPDFPVELKYKDGRERWAFEWQPRLEAEYAPIRAGCSRCPHRGFSLAGLPIRDGKVICPGHGLQWDVETGALVPRVFPDRARGGE